MRRLAVLLACTCFAAALSPSAPGADTRSFAVIVAPDVGPHRLSRQTLSFIYRRKQNFWQDGTRIQPVNLPPNDPVRRAFSQCVLGEPPEATEDYWREMYFHGVLPPHVVASETAVILFVLATPGAVGYVSSCPSDSRVVVAMTIGNPPNCPHRSGNCALLQD